MLNSDILENGLCIAVVCFPGCHVMNFGIKWPKSQDKNLNILKTKRAFKVKSVFHHFKNVFSCQKLSQTWQCAFKQLCCSLIPDTTNWLRKIHKRFQIYFSRSNCFHKFLLSSETFIIKRAVDVLAILIASGSFKIDWLFFFKVNKFDWFVWV